jgi:hypothetical protein
MRPKADYRFAGERKPASPGVVKLKLPGATRPRQNGGQGRDSCQGKIDPDWLTF